MSNNVLLDFGLFERSPSIQIVIGLTLIVMAVAGLVSSVKSIRSQ